MPDVSRVLLVAPQPFYEDRGTPIAVRQLLQALSQLGYEVDLLTFPVGRTIEIPRVRTFRAANPLGIRRVPVGLSFQKLVLDAALVPALLQRLRRGRYLCIHAVEEAAIPAVLLGRRFRVPVIYDMQSSLPEQLAHLRPFRGALVQRLLCRTERWLLASADSVVSSSGLAARVRTVAPRARHSEWLYASPLPPDGPGEADEVRREMGLAPGQPLVLYAGTFEDYQGLPALAAAAPLIRRQVPDAVVALVGAASPAAEARLRAAAGVAGDGALRILARQPRERIPGYLAAADVLVSPRSWGDNLPLKVFDYLKAGKPVVATDIPAHRVALDDSRALLCGTSAEEIAAAVVRLLRDPALAARLAAAGRAYTEERLGWAAFVRSVAELYGRFPGRPAGGLPDGRLPEGARGAPSAP